MLRVLTIGLLFVAGLAGCDPDCVGDVLRAHRDELQACAPGDTCVAYGECVVYVINANQVGRYRELVESANTGRECIEGDCFFIAQNPRCEEGRCVFDYPPDFPNGP